MSFSIDSKDHKCIMECFFSVGIPVSSSGTLIKGMPIRFAMSSPSGTAQQLTFTRSVVLSSGQKVLLNNGPVTPQMVFTSTPSSGESSTTCSSSASNSIPKAIIIVQQRGHLSQTGVSVPPKVQEVPSSGPKADKADNGDNLYWCEWAGCHVKFVTYHQV